MSRKHADYERIVREVGATRLRAIRAELGQSQAEFARSVGLGVKTYGNYERQQRELPQSTRLAIIDKIDADPLATEALYAALHGKPMPTPGTRRVESPEGASFWATLRAECRAFREQTYSKPARAMLTLRDHVYVAATVYFSLKNLAVMVDIPFGVEVNGVDWVLLASFVVIMMLFIPVVSDFPATKVARHLLGLS
ncbi:MAG: helix-turn-helix domain-containing protein [Paracoccus sp. (in: a-proteobacteria)]